MVSIEAINIKRAQSANRLSFSGHDLKLNDKGQKTYRFYLPKVSYDNASVIYRKFKLDNMGRIIKESASDEVKKDFTKGNSYVEVAPSSIRLSDNEVLGYRFVIDEKDYNDKYRFVDYENKKYNISIPLESDVLSTPYSIYHLVPNIFNSKISQKESAKSKPFYITNGKGENVKVDNKTAVMNHFTKFDSNLQDIIAKVPDIKSMGFKRILSTPIFGQDNLSNHGYWTVNPFQITEDLGHIEDFADLQVKLFKNSMGFIADGAFTDEGLSGVHFRDVLRHGSASPFAKWFELHNFPLKKLSLGVLPDSPQGYENMDIRVVNSPVIWDVNGNGSPNAGFGEKNPKYNRNKETFIQIYDRRLASERQLELDKTFDSYEIRNPQNKEDITGWTDSVVPYSFPVDPKEVIRKSKDVLSMINKTQDAPYEVVPAKEFLKEWEHFKLDRATDSSGVTLWTGNKDLAKLRFTTPISKQIAFRKESISNIKGNEDIEAFIDANQQVQDYIASVGEYWTNKTAKILRGHIAKQLAGANSTQDFLNLIGSKIGTELPVEMKYITDVQINNVLNDSYKLNNGVETVPETIKELLDEYPLEALEVSPFLASMLAYPGLKTKMNSESYVNATSGVVRQILAQIDTKRPEMEPLLVAGELNPDTTEVTQLLSDDIARFILIKGLAPDFGVDMMIADDKKDFYEALKNISPSVSMLEMKTPEEKEYFLYNKMLSNIKNISANDINTIANYLASKIDGIDTKQIKVANLLIDKAEAGLNWRIDAAKDIAEIENFAEGEMTPEDTWEEVLNFWRRFNKGVQKYNRHAYKIAEFTDTSLDYTSKSAKFEDAGSTEQLFIDKGGFTTQSNYSYWFSALPSLYSGFMEYNNGGHEGAFRTIASKMLYGWKGVPGYLYSGNKNNLVFSHVAIGNHDKPRMGHGFTMNMPLAYKDNYHGWDDGVKGQVYDDLMSCSLQHASFFKDLQSSKALDGKFYHDDFMSKMDKVFAKISNKNLAKMAALTDAFNTALANNAIENAGIKEMPKNGNTTMTKDDLLRVFTETAEQLATIGSPTAKMFYHRTFETNYDDIVNTIAKDNAELADVFRQIEPFVHKEFVKPAIIRGKALAKLMVALPGAPTLYAGDELLEVGNEDKARNVYLQNRNRLRWEKLTDANYSHVNDFKNELKNIFNVRNQDGLSCLVNGDTTLLSPTSNGNVIGMYRYNDKDDAIILVHNNGFNSSRRLPDDDARNTEIESLYLGEAELHLDGQEVNRIYEKHVGLPSKIATGTTFVDAFDNDRKFVINEEGKLCVMDKDGKPSGENIKLKGSVTILKRLK